MFDVAALGEALIDFTYSGKSKDGQKLFEQNAGGAPCNMLSAVNKCGLKTAFIGKIGDDMHGMFLKETMENAGIDTSGVVVTSDYFTTLAFVDINENGERKFSFARKNSADVMIESQEVDLDILKQSKVFHIGSLSLTSEPAKSTTFYALEKAREFGCIISYDPNYRESLWQSKEIAIKEMRSILPYVNIIKISDEECELLTGEADPILAAKALNSMGVDIVCVTLGKDGAWVAINGTGTNADGFTSKKVADTTGAGDSFFGGFVYKFLQTQKNIGNVTLDEVKDCAVFGNAVASLCVEGRGGIPSMPNYEDVLNRYNSKN